MSGAFGSLKWNSNLNWWSGRIEVTPDHPIAVHVEAANEPAALGRAVELASPAWDRLRIAEPSVRAAVAGQMVEAHNGYCNPEDEVTAEQFAGRLRLLSALFGAAGTVELCYDDGLLFGGHWILVPVGAGGSVGEASEAG